jgi:hypothetical protein
LLETMPGVSDETVIATLTPAHLAEACRRKSSVA